MPTIRRLLLSGRGGGFTAPAEDMIFHGVRAKFLDGVPGGQTIPSETFTPVLYNTNEHDTDDFHPITTDANLTGTVAKTGANATIVGSGTSFTTELAEGYPVRIPGGSQTDIVVVASIADNTHFTAYVAPVGTASGQTAVLDSSVFVAPMAGYFAFHIAGNWRGSGDGGIRESYIWPNNIQPVASTDTDEFTITVPVAGSAETAYGTPGGPLFLSVGEFVQHIVWHDSSGDLDLAADNPGYPFNMWLAGT